MQVLKFGGSSVANAENIKKVKSIIQSKISVQPTIVAVSAFSGVTDLLLSCGQLAVEGESSYKEVIQNINEKHITAIKELLPGQDQGSLLSFVMVQCNEIEDICNGIFLLNDFSDRTKDRLMSFGELLSSTIISGYIDAEGLKNRWLDSRKIIHTNSQFGKAIVDFDMTQRKFKEIHETATENLFIMPGFIGSDQKGNTTTLGRGGSDYTAAIMGAVSDSSIVEIWTDVSGMMSADPRLVANAKYIKNISYHEAMELSHFGAKVIYPPTIQPLMTRNIPVWIKNTFDPHHPGTLIHAGPQENNNMIRGISNIDKISLLSLEGSGMIGIPGFSKRLFEVLANESINVILITQASSEHSICVGVEEHNADRAKEVVDQEFIYEIEKGKLNSLVVENNLAIVALVGDHMRSHQGISGRMFSALGRNGINIRAIAQGSSERNISAVINKADIKKAVNVLHEDFFETSYKQVNLFIIGTGNVGSKLLDQILQQQKYLFDKQRLHIRVIGLANSRTMLFKEEGIELQKWKELLADGEKMDLQSFIKKMQESNLRNAVFVDITANEQVADFYEQIFLKSISVVACNKIAASSLYENYYRLKELARDYNASFLFETNVGAGLPIINTLNNLLQSGDSITSIEAVLSGTLNYVFNHYNGEIPFAEIVHQAQQEGYTEPDPRLDLSGMDVMRKIMILAREAGERLEMENITNVSFMPESCMQGSVDDFYKEMRSQEAHFKQLFIAASSAGKKLKFVATYENHQASVSLKHIDPQHDFYHLYGKDNIVLFFTHRYKEQPMIVKGAGAGAEVTASGVFADIIRTISN